MSVIISTAIVKISNLKVSVYDHSGGLRGLSDFWLQPRPIQVQVTLMPAHLEETLQLG